MTKKLKVIIVSFLSIYAMACAPSTALAEEVQSKIDVTLIESSSTNSESNVPKPTKSSFPKTGEAEKYNLSLVMLGVVAIGLSYALLNKKKEGNHYEKK